MWLHAKSSLANLSSVRFLIVGLANTSVGLLIIYIGKWLIGWDDIVANMVGYSCGLILSFVLNKRWTFRYKGSSGRALFRFVLVILLAYLLNLGLTLAAINDFGINSYVAQALGIVPYTIITYLGSRYFAFPDSHTFRVTTV